MPQTDRHTAVGCVQSRTLPLAIFVALAMSGCKPAVQPPAPNVIIVPVAAIPEDPLAPQWNAAAEHVARLILQDLVEPRQMRATTPEVRVRALSDGVSAGFRLEWIDPTKNDLPDVGLFCDACAIQIPAKIDPTVPAPQMGEPGRPVEVVYWSASWQAIVEGRADSIRAFHPNASVDHYPFQAPPLGNDTPPQREMATRYSPARALGNFMAGPREKPVQDLVAEGPGTLKPVADGMSKGQAVRTSDGWAVVIVRKLPAGLGPNAGSQVALAVWQGAAGEVGSRKMRTGWIPLAIQEKR